MKKKMFGCAFILLLWLLFPGLQSYAKDVVVVIDPGHGGENQGGLYQEYVEKELTMETAMAMKERLEKFEGVTVYLTHENTTDPDMKLDKRVEYAKSVNADFLFSLHYNMSVDHRLYGSEVWVSAFDPYYTSGVSFGSIEMEAFDSFGLFNRGIKIRYGSKGTDYYGIIRHGVENQIPTVIIEHCHMDQEHDRAVLAATNSRQAFGIADAESVAKYFKLISSELGEDYSGLADPEISNWLTKVVRDDTPPDPVSISLSKYDADKHQAEISLTASDSDSRILYYDYSTDGGASYSNLQPFPATEDDTCSFVIDQLPNQEQQIICRAYNLYDRSTESGEICIDGYEEEATERTSISEEASASDTAAEDESAVPVIKQGADNSHFGSFSVGGINTIQNILLVILIILIVLFVMLNIIFLCTSKKHRKAKKRKHKHRR